MSENPAAEPNPELPGTDIEPTNGRELALILRLPAEHRCGPDASFYEGDDDGYCRLIRPDGSRCQGIRLKAYGLCSGHAGTSKLLQDPSAHGRRGNEGKARIRERHALLASHGVNPRRAARAAAISRTDAIVRALVDEPLDDPQASPQQRQRTTIAMLDAVFPLATVSAEVELPVDAAGVEALGWSEMQALAARIGVDTQLDEQVVIPPHTQ